MKFQVTQLIALFVLAIYVTAECPNACSGHGTCHNNDECHCDPNWMSADCSERVCPFGLSFVDTPRGDLNHNGMIDGDTLSQVQWSNKMQWEKFPFGDAIDPNPQEAHFYAECSNRGICDRELGVCQCFDGYTGSSCQRTTCPSGCSGHGVCRTIQEIAGGSGASNGLIYRKTDSIRGENFWTGVTEGFDYKLWDMDKAQACVCDPGYSGPDCTRRECPRGDDPLTHRDVDCGGSMCTDEVQTVTMEAEGSIDAKYFLVFHEWTGVAWNTDYFTVSFDGNDNSDDVSSAIRTALMHIPSRIVEDVSVSTTASPNTGGTSNMKYTAQVTFTKNPGNLEQMELKLHPKHLNYERTQSVVTNLDFSKQTVTTHTEGNKEETVCSNRGICDTESGLCVCFKGYYHDDCSVQNALAM